MKRKYEAPVMSFEDFELSMSIAAGCEFRTYHAMYECSYETTTGRVIFVNRVETCTTKAQDGDYGICYHVPTDNTNLFTS